MRNRLGFGDASLVGAALDEYERYLVLHGQKPEESMWRTRASQGLTEDGLAPPPPRPPTDEELERLAIEREGEA